MMINTQLTTVYEDDDLIIIDKLQGMLSIEDGYIPEEPNLRAILKNLYGKIWAVHRLDRLTSGLILFAKNHDAHQILNKQFQRRSVRKKYKAISHGKPIWDSKTIDIPLKINGDRKHRTIAGGKDDKQARTEIQVIKKSEEFTFLSLSPKTGYTHQIRTHLSMIGFPILGDPLYWRLSQITIKSDYFKILQYQNLCLHADYLEFLHPRTDKTLCLHTPLPDYFLEIMGI